jgi:serine/threonine-protein kinase RsbW
MEIALILNLPADAAGVPLVRHILAEVMRVAGVTDECIDELSVAVTEACGNVLRHSVDSSTATYAVRARLDHHAVSLEVVDTGPGFDPAAVPRAPRDAEVGRGLALMQALVDKLGFSVSGGTIAHMRKRLGWRDDAPLHRLAERSSPQVDPAPPAPEEGSTGQ